MSRWGEIFLGVIAVSTLTTTVMLVALALVGMRLARRVEGLTRQIEQEMKPAFGHLNAIARDASRAAALATLQVERVDRLFGDVLQRVDDTVGAVQGILGGGPLAKGGAVAAGISALRAVFNVIRDARSGRTGRRKDDEDALFI